VVVLVAVLTQATMVVAQAMETQAVLVVEAVVRQALQLEILAVTHLLTQLDRVGNIQAAPQVNHNSRAILQLMVLVMLVELVDTILVVGKAVAVAVVLLKLVLKVVRTHQEVVTAVTVKHTQSLVHL
tara:strand:+ start:152 stop:532 length:381 start_codon:yes stop_codon:yes gene_type:complete